MNRAQIEKRKQILADNKQAVDELIRAAFHPKFNAIFSDVANNIPEHERQPIKAEILRQAQLCKRPFATTNTAYDTTETLCGDMRCIVDTITERILKDFKKKWSNKYTLGVYEAVTNKVLYKKYEEQYLLEQEVASFELAHQQTGVLQHHAEPYYGLNFSVPVEKSGVLQTLSLVSLAPTGCVVKAPLDYKVKTGNILTINFSYLEKDYGFDQPPKYKYRVAAFNKAKNHLLITCVLFDDTSSDWEQFILDWASTNRRTLKQDAMVHANMAYETAFTELVANNTCWLPIFISIDEGKAKFRYVLETEQNRHVFDDFRTETEDFEISSVLDVPIIKTLMVKKQTIVFKIKTEIKGRTVFISDTLDNLKKSDNIELLFNYGMQKAEVKCYLAKMVVADPNQVKYAVERETHEFEGADLNFLEETQSELSSITHIISFLPLPNLLSDLSASPINKEQLKHLNVLIKKRRKEVLTRVSAQLKESRKESRYHYEMSGKLGHGGVVYECQTKDLSVSGLRVELDKPISIATGERVTIDFPELRKLLRKAKIKSLIYEVRFVSGENKVLHLLRDSSIAKTVKPVIEQFIDANRDDLKLDVFIDKMMFAKACLKVLFTSHYPGVAFTVTKGRIGKTKIGRMLFSYANDPEMSFINELSNASNVNTSVFPLFCELRSKTVHILPLMKSSAYTKDETDIIYYDINQKGTLSRKQVKSALSSKYRRHAFVEQAEKEGAFESLWYNVKPLKVEETPGLNTAMRTLRQHGRNAHGALTQELKEIEGLMEVALITDLELIIKSIKQVQKSQPDILDLDIPL